VNTSACQLKNDYITICGNKDPIRYGTCRNINLTNFLPQYLKNNNEIFAFTQFFENYLNDMYSGTCGYSVTSATDTSAFGGSLSTSANIVEIDSYSTTPPLVTSASTISILEKVYRLAETHDPDLIDLNYIQHFASYLGYDINVNKDELGTFENDGPCFEHIQDKYLRFMISNLPNWYKIKTTENAVKIMLFSFGLVGDIIHYYTDDYENNWVHSDTQWNSDINALRENLTRVPNSYYSTPHIALIFNLNKTRVNYSFDVNLQTQLANAVLSIKDINIVFRGVHGYYLATNDVYITPLVRNRKHIYLISDVTADNWNN
jgi:hypothetical protein